MSYVNGWFVKVCMLSWNICEKKPYKLFSNIVVFVQGTVKFIKFVIFIENILIYQHSQKTLL